LDEISLSAPTRVHEVKGDRIRSFTVTPEDADMSRVPLSAVKSGTPQENANRLRDVLQGIEGPDRDYVLINAAAGLLAAERAATLLDGIELAAESIDSGDAR